MRSTAQLLATRAEFEGLQHAGFHATVLMESPEVLTLYKRAYYGPTLKLPPVYHSYDQIVARADELVREHPERIARVHALLAPGTPRAANRRPPARRAAAGGRPSRPTASLAGSGG